MGKAIEPGLVTTIIPVFNRPVMIEEAVNSVLAQDYRPIEVIVVDDGSTDDTAKVLRSLTARHQEVKILQQANAGPGAARELARQQACGEYIQYLDSDDLLLPMKFTRQVEALQRNPDCGAVYGKTELAVAGFPPIKAPLKRTGEKIGHMFPALLRERWWSTSTPLYCRAVIDQVGAWSNTKNEEDWEYECRIAALGTKLAYVEEFVSVTRRHNEHLSHAGTSDLAKLKDRCYARTQMYQSACRSVIPIPLADMQFFSKSVFLLARECAAAGLDCQTEQMLSLSVKASGAANFKHRLFALTGRVLGWRSAARIVTALGR